MRKAIAIDFDGCLCENAWPKIGAPHWDVIRAAQLAQHEGAALILWTCRSEDLLTSAVEWCRERGLIFDAINENLSERLEYYGSESRKISADEYWDDRAVHMPAPPNDPLTLEELREMDGEPVWVHSLDGDGKDTWAFVDTDCEVVKIFVTRFSVKCMGTLRHFKTYGKTWLAYRRNPEGNV